jgi:hypothetical protein
MTKTKVDLRIIDKLNEYFAESYLVSYGVKEQFIELEFSNTKFRRLVLNIDCNLDSDDEELNSKVEMFKVYSIDTYKLSLFHAYNLKKVESCSLSNEMFKLFFENRKSLIFSLDSEFSNFTITFFSKEIPGQYEAFHFDKSGIKIRTSMPDLS